MRKFLFTILILSLCLCLCGCRLLSALNQIAEDINSELESEAENLDKGENQITNALGESYIIKYKERMNVITRNDIDIEIIAGHTLIKYSSVYRGATVIPNRVLHLFRNGDTDYYFAGSDYDFLFAYDNETQCGKELDFDERTDLPDELLEKKREENRELSETLSRNIKRAELVEKFRACGYDDAFILKVYDYQ